ncbi:MAG TPA: PfkB family carbohydrate kinase [Solirubrobacteraceae bacterium]|nr:PfkB family carbohydrate kinase [Solirubrobacteraceae bacterium]
MPSTASATSAERAPTDPPAISVFAPNPLLTVAIEREGADRDSVHFHAGGQGVWAAQMALTMGAAPLLCGFIGGEAGQLLGPLLEKAIAPAHLHLVRTDGASGCYVVDCRSGRREVLAMRFSEPPSRHELDELFSLTCAQALACGWLLVTNPFPGDALPLELYGDLVADAQSGGCRTLVDLSVPRLDSALAGEPDLVKLNDWELAEYVRGPVSTPQLLLASARRLREAGARRVLVTRGELPALVLDGEETSALTPPRFERGFREGCGDSMMGALAAAWAGAQSFERALILGAAAGAANFLRHGLGHASREVVEELAAAVKLEPWSSLPEC